MFLHGLSQPAFAQEQSCGAIITIGADSCQAIEADATVATIQTQPLHQDLDVRFADSFNLSNIVPPNATILTWLISAKLDIRYADSLNVYDIIPLADVIRNYPLFPRIHINYADSFTVYSLREPFNTDITPPDTPLSVTTTQAQSVTRQSAVYIVLAMAILSLPFIAWRRIR